MPKRNRLTDQVVLVDPLEITPAHSVDRPEVVDALSQTMLEEGWRGRPLAVSKVGRRYFAWTGVHRLAAAIRSGLEAVPVVIAPASKYSARNRFGVDKFSDLVRVDDAASRYVYENDLDPSTFESWSPEFLLFLENLGVHREVVELLDNELWEP